MKTGGLTALPLSSPAGGLLHGPQQGHLRHTTCSSWADKVAALNGLDGIGLAGLPVGGSWQHTSQTSQVPQQLKPSQLVQQGINPHHGQLDTNVLQATAAAAQITVKVISAAMSGGVPKPSPG